MLQGKASFGFPPAFILNIIVIITISSIDIMIPTVIVITMSITKSITAVTVFTISP